MKARKQELTCMDKFQLQNMVSKLDTTLTRDSQRKDKLVPQDRNSKTVHFSDVAGQRCSQQWTGDDDQQVTVREVSPHESKLSPHFYQRSTWEFKVKEQIDLERGQIAIEETEEVERIKDHQHSMELDNEQPDQQHMLSQCFSQQHGKPSFQWHSVGQLGRKDQKKDDLLQKTKFVKSSRELQKPEVRGALQSIPLSNSGELSQPLTYTAMPTASLGPSYNNITVSAIVRQQREKQPGLGTVLTSVTGVHSSQLDSQKQWVQPSMSFGRHRSNSLPETPLSSGVASVESITDSMTPSNINSPSTGTAPKPSLVAKADQPVVALSQNKQVETISKLMSLFQNSMELDNDQQPEQPDQQTEQPDQQQIPSQHFSQQQDGKLSFQQRSVGHLGQKDRKRDDLFQKTKLLQSTREFQKPEVRGPLQSIPLSKSGELSQPLTSAAVLTSLGPSHNITVPVILGKQREKPLGLETVSTATGVNSSQLDSQSEQVQPSLSFGQHRSNSLPENPIASRVASAGSTTDSVTPLNINSPTGTTPMPSLVAKVDQPVAALSQNKHVETISKLVSMFQHSMELDNDQQLEQPDQQQMPSWCFSQQQDGKLSFQCHSIGQLGQKDKKRDDSLQKTKLVQISRQLQKLEVKGASQSSPLSKLGELSQPLTSAAVLTGCFGPSYNKIAAHVALGKQREEPLALATVSTKVTGVNSSQLDSWNEHVQSSMSFGRCRSNSFPEMLTASGSASPGSVTDSMIPLKIPSPSTGTASMCSFVGKTDQPVAALGQNKHLETISKLVSVLQRHGIHTRKRKVDELPEVKKQPHYWPLHLDALASDANNEDQEDAKGQRSVTDSMIPSKTNSSSTGIAPMHSLVAKTDRLALALREDTHFETISKLVTMFQRHGLHTKKRKTEEFPEVKKQPPHWPLQLIALPSDVNNEDQQDVEGQRSMASSLVLGGVKVCKSRIINFERTDFLPQGTPVTLHINRVRLVMCERAKDGMVEAVVQYLSSSTPHDDLLSLPNTHYADTLAMQFCALMVKDGYKLTEDQIQPVQSQPNFPPTPASAV